jgi:hypothetical protein
MAPRPISLADRLRALARLEPRDDRTKAVLLDMMRSQESPGNVRQAAYRAAAPPPRAQSATLTDWLLRGDRAAKKPAPAAQQPSPSAQPNATQVTPLARRPIWAPVPLAQPGLAGVGSVPAREPLPIIDLGKARAVLAALAATPTSGGPIDTSALLERITRGLPMHRLPRLQVWSVRRGLRLLMDCSPAMMPLRYDAESVKRRLELILGGDRLQLLYFDGCPSRGVGAGERSGWTRWEAPAPGMPVVMLTELGCAGPRGNLEWASPEEWGRFAVQVRDAGTALVALVPYPARRVPSALAQRIIVVPWGEDLGAARVQRILRDARMQR